MARKKTLSKQYQQQINRINKRLEELAKEGYNIVGDFTPTTPKKPTRRQVEALKKVTQGEHNFELNKKEILFFEMLVQHQNSVLTRDMFLAYVYEYEPMSESALNNFIMRLRRRFGKQFLHTIPDVGYKLIV